MPNEETITIIETAEDGKETVIEIIADHDANGHENIEVYEAVFDGNQDDQDAAGHFGQDHAGDPSLTAPEPLDADDATHSVDDAGVYTPVQENAADHTDPVTSSTDATHTDATDTTHTEPTDTEASSHATAATDAQEAADNFVAHGDYTAAEQARETAENEAYQAGDNSLLHGSNSTELDNAATGQQNSEYYEHQEADHAQHGDYEAAKEDAGNAAQAIGNADWYAGGGDHTGQAQAEHDQMNNAVSEQSNADWYAYGAEEYAAQGNVDSAQAFADHAADHQAEADYHGALGDHDAVGAVHDDTSHVDSGGTYDASHVDVTDHSNDYSTDHSTE